MSGENEGSQVNINKIMTCVNIIQAMTMQTITISNKEDAIKFAWIFAGLSHKYSRIFKQAQEHFI